MDTSEPSDDSAVEADSGAAEDSECRVCQRDVEVLDHTGLRLPTLGRILGVDAGLDRMSLRLPEVPRRGEALGDVQLQLDKVQPGGLGHRVLDLEAVFISRK